MTAEATTALGSLPGHVHEALPMKLKAEVLTACTIRLHPFPEQLEKLLQKSCRIQNEISIGARGGGKLMHPERGLRRLVIVPGDARRVEKVEVPNRGLEPERFCVPIADLSLRVPDVNRRKAFERFRLGVRPRVAVVCHHREPDCKALQMSREFL